MSKGLITSRLKLSTTHNERRATTPSGHRKISFSSLSVPQETYDSYMERRLVQLTKTTPLRSKSSMSSASEMRFKSGSSSFFQSECEASETGKADLHRKIIDIGTSTQDSILNEIRLEYEEKLKIRDQQLNEYYKREKETAIQQERAKFSAKIDLIKQEMQAEFEAQFREKVSENEIYNQNIAKEQIEMNRIEAKKLLQDTVAKLQAQAKLDQQKAIEETIASEKKLAAELLEKQSQLHERKIIELNETKLNEMNQKLEELRIQVTSYYEELIVQHVDKVLREKEAEIEAVKREYELKLIDAAGQYEAKLNEIRELNERVSERVNEIKDLKSVIDEIRDEYQSCIAHFAHLKKKEADFLFPQLVKINLD